MGIVFLTSTMAGYIHARDKETPDGVVLTNNVKGDDRMKLLIIGKTGTGKSSLCNVITGHPMDSDIFPVSAEAVSCTQSTQFGWVNFNANVGRPISLIDTIGFDDPKKDKDADIIGELVHQLKNNCDYVNLFMIAVNGQNPRLDGALMGMIRIFEGMFGQEFWKQAVIAFTRIPMDVKSIKKRNKNTKQSDEELAKEYLKVVENEFPNGNGLQYLFLDACYDTEEDADPAEKEAFDNAMKILWKSLNKSPGLPTTKVQDVETESKKLKMAIEEKEKERQLILEKLERKEQEWEDAQENLKLQREEDRRMAAEEQARFLEHMQMEREKIKKLKLDMEKQQTEEKKQEKADIEKRMKAMERKHQQTVENMTKKQKDEQEKMDRKIKMEQEELEKEPGFWTNVGRGALAGATLGISEIAGLGKKWFGKKE